jgi:hypothetical protein
VPPPSSGSSRAYSSILYRYTGPTVVLRFFHRTGSRPGTRGGTAHVVARAASGVAVTYAVA